MFDHFNEAVFEMQVDIVSFMYSFYFEANHEKDPFDSFPKNLTVRELWAAGYTSMPLMEIVEVDLTNNQAVVNDTALNSNWRADDDFLFEKHPYKS